jgi:hypothetical protein
LKANFMSKLKNQFIGKPKEGEKAVFSSTGDI